MSKSGAIANTLPNITTKYDKDHIPIRSITYFKKKQTEIRDIRSKRGSLPGISPEAAFSNVSSPQLNEASTAYTRSDKALISPRYGFSLHKLKFGEKTKSNVSRSILLSPKQTISRPKLHVAPLTARTQNTDVDDEHNYFKLLFDEKRKRFNVQECEGVDEFYTNEMIMERIHKMGFRDQDYYSTRIVFDTLQAPDEKNIKEDHMLKISPWISTMENQKTLVSHVLGGSRNNISYIESVIEEAKQMSQVCEKKKQELRDEMNELNDKFEKEIETILEDFKGKFSVYGDRINDNEISNQTLRFKLQKELMLLKREKLNLESKIKDSVEYLHKVENTLYGKDVFKLEVNQSELENIQDMNLRRERAHLMKNNEIVH